MSRPPLIRTCAGCGQKRCGREMLRILRTPEGEIRIDEEQKGNGRGAYLCRQEACLEKARRRKDLARTLRAEIPQEVMDALEKEIAQCSRTGRPR